MLNLSGEVAALVLAFLLGVYIGWTIRDRAPAASKTRRGPRHAAPRRFGMATAYGTGLSTGDVRMLPRNGGRRREPAHANGRRGGVPVGQPAEAGAATDPWEVGRTGIDETTDVAQVGEAESAVRADADEPAENAEAVGEHTPVAEAETGEPRQATAEPDGPAPEERVVEAVQPPPNGESAVPTLTVDAPEVGAAPEGGAVPQVGAVPETGAAPGVGHAPEVGAVPEVGDAPEVGDVPARDGSGEAPHVNGMAAGATTDTDGDDLRRIVGIGPVIQGVLVGAGVTTYRQVAELGEQGETLTRVGEALGGDVRARSERQRWVEQARELHFQKYGERL